MSNLFTAHGQNIACGPMSPAEGDEVTAAATGGSTLWLPKVIVQGDAKCIQFKHCKWLVTSWIIYICLQSTVC